MKIAFVVMPWHSPGYPCLAAGLLHAVVQQSRPNWEFEQWYANLLWIDYLNDSAPGRFSPLDYGTIGEELIYDATGEWVFSSALHGASAWRVEEYKNVFDGTDKQFEIALAAHRLAPTFIADLAAKIVATKPTVLALTSTFVQNVACLALAQAVKRINPTIITVMGGGNCDGVQGRTLHRNFPFVDYVVSGEGEVAFNLLLEAIEHGRADLEHVQNLCWRDANGQRINPEGGEVTLESNPTPCFDEYFEQLEGSSARAYVEPQLVVETARGCWWGEKHHCTFCGLNGTGMHFRSKSAERALSEIEELIRRHKTST